MKQLSVVAVALVLLTAVSCRKEKKSVPAEVTTTAFLVNGSATQGSHNFFSFSSGGEVPVSDSATNRWDFAMRFEAFLVNSAASGPGNAGVQVLNQPFDAVTIAPEAGYRFDTTAIQRAVKPDDWYIYNAVTRSFAPIAGRTFVFRTATNRFGKLEILSADPADDNGNLVVPPTRPTKIKYNIRFAYQPDGTRNF
ncbi:MAG TPA: HmuY family protein [Lacibacter sp.]|nr:HmuY family protein [Lacibacter sp.]HMO88029.1 HmuY family protein [Lacibacter sp.]HMP87885.1 HmuY family protein [Lacibacter sp.]